MRIPFKRFYLLPLAIFLGSIANVASGSEALAFDRARFGNAAIPVWSELTPFEQKTIANAERARSGDPEALLALYLLASGDVRDQEAFSRYHHRINQWLADNQKIANTKNEAKRAERLHRAMHRDFFLAAGQDGTVQGYDLDQSQLSTLLDTEVFNCISSALLYVVLARKLDLEASGVIMPSHAFVQLNFTGGETVEVETTSRNGYDLEHDEAFYSPESGRWFADRSLEAPTYSQYQQRDIVSAYQLGLENMWSQHVKAERMAYPDRMRLAELRAHLQPDNLDAQSNRLFFYTREFTYLNDRRDYSTLIALYNQIGPYLRTLDEYRSLDPDFDNLLAWVKSGMAVAFLNSESPEKGLQLARQQLRDFDNTLIDSVNIRSNLLFVIANYANQQTGKKNFARARAVFDGYEFDCLENTACENAFGKLYADWAQHYWDRENWEQAISLYSAYLKLNESSEAADTFRANLESAFLNWASAAAYDEDWIAADDRLERCVAELPMAQRCETQLRALRK